jgi:hypothetical protein
MAVDLWLMTDAKRSAGILDKGARVPARLISHQPSGINHFGYGTDSDLEGHGLDGSACGTAQ